jgi:hypothetical protein
MTDTTHEAPERIWAKPNIGRIILYNPAPNLDALIARGYLTEYVRADLVQAAVAAALTEATKALDYYVDADYCAMGYPEDGGIAASGTARDCQAAILALITPDAQAALDRVVAEQRKPHRAAAALLSADMMRLAPLVLNAMQAERDKWEQNPEVLRGGVPAETITLAMFEACLAAIRKGGE